MASGVASLQKKLSKHTPFFGIQVWILILTLTAILLAVILTILYLCIIFRRRKKCYKLAHFRLKKNPITQKTFHNNHSTSSLDRRLLSSNNVSEIEMNLSKPELQLMLSDQCSTKSSGTIDQGSVVIDLERWCGNRLTLKEIEVVTNDFAEENMIASGDYGIVYRAILLDNTRVAVKRLLSYRVSQAEDFIKEVEAVGNLRHKNLVKLLGYCVEGYNRILVYEYIDNGNLHQWLHGSLGQLRPLTWGMRMNIIRGIAKGLTYLHEDIEPKIVHQNLKSSNILLDHQWNPKISDIGIEKLHGLEWGSSATCAMGKSGYLDRECASSGVSNEKSDVYSFGILIMEIVSGRIPVDRSQPQVYLIDWLKSMVAKQKIAFVLDPKLPEMPSLKELKRIILIALRCVDPEVKHRPKMGHVIHMLEPRDLLLNNEPQIKKAASYHNYPQGSEAVARDASDANDREDQN